MVVCHSVVLPGECGPCLPLQLSMLDSVFDVGGILSNCTNPLLACPMLSMCMVAEPANCFYVKAISFIIFCNNKIIHLLVDHAYTYMCKVHDLGNFGVGAGRCASKECHHPFHDYGMDRIMATSVLSAIFGWKGLWQLQPFPRFL